MPFRSLGTQSPLLILFISSYDGSLMSSHSPLLLQGRLVGHMKETSSAVGVGLVPGRRRCPLLLVGEDNCLEVGRSSDGLRPFHAARGVGVASAPLE